MPRQVKTSPLRQAQANATRARIAEAAAVVFEARGFDAARVEDIASQAGVAYPTVYKSFGNKRKLLEAALDAVLSSGVAGALERQDWFREQLDAPTGEQQLRLIARNARRMYDRSGRLLEVVRAAAAADQQIDGLWQDFHDERVGRSRTSAERLANKARLHTTVADAARTLWTLSVPEIYVLQVARGGLSAADYERWLGDLLIAALLER